MVAAYGEFILFFPGDPVLLAEVLGGLDHAARNRIVAPAGGGPAAGECVVQQDTGWTVKELPPGFSKVVEGYRTLRGKVGPVAHIVYSDGLVAVSVFVEPMPQAPQPIGLSQQGGINVYSRQLDNHLVTVLGETPGTTVRQIAVEKAKLLSTP